MFFDFVFFSGEVEGRILFFPLLNKMQFVLSSPKCIDNHSQRLSKSAFTCFFYGTNFFIAEKNESINLKSQLFTADFISVVYYNKKV